MDVARLNCSHASHEELTQAVQYIRKASKEQTRPVAVLLDLQGPKIRLGHFPDGPVEIQAGDIVSITTKELPHGCNAKKINTVYKRLVKDVSVGDRILIDDGNIEMKVKKIINSTEIECVSLFNGTLSSHKGMNLPGIKTSVPILNQKDKQDLLHGLSLNVDYVALSFVRQPQDVLKIQKFIQAQGKDTPVIAKIEKPEAVKNIDKIIAVADGIMIARGDMAVEISPQKVPSIQKQIIQKCNAKGKTVILATQMLESMTYNPRPTRAEASDVANGVFDGADALMLSGETAYGKYPFKALQIMTDIIGQAEQDRQKLKLTPSPTPPISNVPDAIEYAAAQIAKNSGARAICCITNSGKGAQTLSTFRSTAPIFALTNKKQILQRLALTWGVKGILIPKVSAVDHTFLFVSKTVVDWWNTYLTGAFRPMEKGDLLVITIGLPISKNTKTNTVKVHTIDP